SRFLCGEIVSSARLGCDSIKRSETAAPDVVVADAVPQHVRRGHQPAAVVFHLQVALECRLRRQPRWTEAGFHSRRTDTYRDACGCARVVDSRISRHRVGDVILEAQVPESDAVVELPGIEVQPGYMARRI